MKLLLLFLFFILMTSNVYSQLCRDSIHYKSLINSIEEKFLIDKVDTILKEKFGTQLKEESLAFYTKENEIFKFLFNDQGVYKGYYILWLTEMIKDPVEKQILFGPIRNYIVELSDDEIHAINKWDYSQLLNLADTTIYKPNFKEMYFDGVKLRIHNGQFGVIYTSKECDIEYFERDSILTDFDVFLKEQLNTYTKRNKILKNLDFKFYSFGGCSFTRYRRSNKR